MRTIHIERLHNLGRQELRALGERLTDKLRTKLGGEYHWQGDNLYYRQSGASAQIQLADTKVIVSVELGPLLAAFAGMVESEINRVLDQQLADAGGGAPDA